MEIRCNNGILCTAEQLVIMAANTDDFDSIIDYVMYELEGYDAERPPHTLGTIGLCAAMFKMGIGSSKTWCVTKLDRDMLDMLLDVADGACGDVNMGDLIEVYISSMLMSGQWVYPL